MEKNEAEVLLVSRMFHCVKQNVSHKYWTVRAYENISIWNSISFPEIKWFWKGD